MEASVGDDDKLTEALSESDPRTIKDVRDFLKVVADNGSVCAIEFKGTEFGFRDTHQVRRSAARLDENNVHEEDIRLAGSFEGFLPKGRKVEFLNAEDGETLTCVVDPSTDNAERINAILGHPVIVNARATRVGQGRPSYVIRSFQER